MAVNQARQLAGHRQVRNRARDIESDLRCPRGACAPYHVRLGSPAISALDPALQPRLRPSATTAMCIPLDRGRVTIRSIEKWLDEWDESALLFLQTVGRVALTVVSGTAERELKLFLGDGVADEVSGGVAPSWRSVGGVPSRLTGEVGWFTRSTLRSRQNSTVSGRHRTRPCPWPSLSGCIRTRKVRSTPDFRSR
jgi:hypothetical protein